LFILNVLLNKSLNDNKLNLSLTVADDF